MVDIEVRLAVIDDAPELFQLLVGIQKEFPVSSISPGKAYAMVRKIVREGVVFVATIEGEIIGSIGLMPAPWWFSDEPFLKDYWTAVKKSRRNTRAITLLFEAAMDFCDKTGAVMILGLFTEQRRALKSRLYKRKFKPIGEFFAYNL